MQNIKMLWFIIVVFLLVFYGCGDNDKVITVLGESSASIDAIAEIQEDFTRKTGFEIVTLGFPLVEAMEKANVDFTSRTGKYDVVLQYNFSLSSYVRNNYVFYIDEIIDQDIEAQTEIENDLFKNSWEEVGFYYKNPNERNTEYIKVGYPFASNTMLLVYNKTMLNDEDNQRKFLMKYGYDLQPPSEWQEIKDVAEFFTDIKKNTYGICLQGATGGWLYYEWANFAFGMDGGVMDKKHGWEGDLNTPFLLTSENTIKATELYLSLKPYNKGAFFNVDAVVQLEEFLQGNVALAFVWSDYLYSTFYNSQLGGFDKRFGYTSIPGDKSALAGGAYFINRNSKNPLATKQFILWLLQKDNQIQMVNKGLSSPRMSVYQSPEVQHIPYIKALAESIENGVYMYEAGPDADLISESISKWIQRAWRGEISAKEALTNALNEIKKGRETIFQNL